LLPKLHKQRCVISLLPSELHIHKSVRKKAKKYHLTLNQNFRQVVQYCRAQHEHCWLYPPLVAALEAIMLEQDGMEATVVDESAATNKKGERRPSCRAMVRIYSIEVWNTATQRLVAGELGYTVGSIYTSLTGFSKEDSAGSVQLAALGSALVQSGFQMWDLGMWMEYKEDLGAKVMERADFIEFVHRVRQEYSHLVLSMENGMNARTMIDAIMPPPPNQQQPCRKDCRANENQKEEHHSSSTGDASPSKKARRKSPNAV
jgi:Leu/Phe-tRNA-protein transferase